MNTKLANLMIRCIPDISMNDRVRYDTADNDIVLYSDCSDMMVHSFDVCTNGEVILYVDDGECIELKDENDPQLNNLSLWVRKDIV